MTNQTTPAANATASWIFYPNSVLAYDINHPAGTAYYHKPRGSWNIENIFAVDAYGARRVPLITDTGVYVT